MKEIEKKSKFDAYEDIKKLGLNNVEESKVDSIQVKTKNESENTSLFSNFHDNCDETDINYEIRPDVDPKIKTQNKNKLLLNKIFN